jgi:hypothetical protein
MMHLIGISWPPLVQTLCLRSSQEDLVTTLGHPNVKYA